jgi:hypothetical protein
MAEKVRRPKRPPQGLIGLFGHTYVPDIERPNETRIQWQFEIIRRMRGDRYVVQLFSWMDGSPTEVKVMTEADLLGPDVRLYATIEQWNIAYEKEASRHRYRQA